MTARVTDADVLAIIDTELADLSPFITAAHLLVEQYLGTCGLDPALLKEIERWVSAHYVCSRDPRKRSETMGDASVTYETAMQGENKGLYATSYGKQAITLDPTGSLAGMGMKSASMEAL